VVAVPAAVVLGADTEVILDDEVFGKPADAADAAAMLRRLSARTHEVVTAVSVVSAGRELQAVSRSQVTVAELDDGDIAGYLASGEWQGKAGAYAIQGRFEAHIVHLSGSYSGVMGLPLHQTVGLLRQFGLLP
jgi:septum formation protein